jgi:hypothetical protein
MENPDKSFRIRKPDWNQLIGNREGHLEYLQSKAIKPNTFVEIISSDHTAHKVNDYYLNQNRARAEEELGKQQQLPENFSGLLKAPSVYKTIAVPDVTRDAPKRSPICTWARTQVSGTQRPDGRALGLYEGCYRFS